MSVSSKINKPNSKDIKLPEKVSYGLGNFAANLLLTTANTYMVFYYTDVVGITAAVVGTLLLVAKIIDGLFDLGVGAFLDEQDDNGREKARPWLKRLAVPFGIALILMYSVPDFSSGFKTVYAFVTYIFAMFIFSAISVPYNTMISLSSTNPIERSELSSYRNMLGSVGGWGLTVVTLPLVVFFGNGRQGWFFLAVIYGIIASLAYLLCYRNTKERVVAVSRVTDTGKLRDKIKVVSKNKYWWIVLVIMILTFITAGLGGVNVYFAKYIMGSADYVGALGTANYIPMILGSVVLIPLAAKFSKKTIVMSGLGLNTLGCLVILIGSHNVPLIIAGNVLKGTGSAAIFGLIYAMFGDTVDYGEWKFGKRAEGLTFSAGSFSEKIGSGIGVIILGFALNIGGYVGGKAVQTASALQAINFIFIYLPLLIDIICIVLLMFYGLDKMYNSIRADLDESAKYQA
ncbi:MFS transporter [Lactiplantibacillus pingfangensis]|uniref:MFS transporter n=1 Tax=Lactiplantibacillus pingfangensis TaxID=2559915 RepID=UPI0010F9993E|nr:glycoside-pentoside-hexuronide (GPH):cation symporter [Lactiplantibacillus pingfangensis]